MAEASFSFKTFLTSLRRWGTTTGNQFSDVGITLSVFDPVSQLNGPTKRKYKQIRTTMKQVPFCSVLFVLEILG